MLRAQLLTGLTAKRCKVELDNYDKFLKKAVGVVYDDHLPVPVTILGKRKFAEALR